MSRVMFKKIKLTLTVLSFSLASPTHATESSPKKPVEDTGVAQTYAIPNSGSIEKRELSEAPSAPEAGAAKGPGVAVSDAQREVADTGYSKDAETFYAAVKKLKAEADAIKGVANIPSYPDIVTLEEAAAYYNRFHSTCVETQAKASWVCREKTSPKLQDTLMFVNGFMGVASMAGGSVNNSCDTFSKVMNGVKTGLAAYTAICSTARAACEASCSTVENNLKRIKTTLPRIKEDCIATPGYETACESYDLVLREVKALQGVPQKDSDIKDIQSVSLKNAACTYDYTKMLASAGMGILSMVKGMQQGDNCEEQSNGTAVAAADMCKDPTKAKTEECLCKNPQSPECICVRNPATPGCSNSLQKPGESSGGSSIALGPTDKTNLTTGGGPDLGLDNKGAEMSDRNPSSADGGSLPGAPNGGGAAGLGGGSGGGSGVAGPNEGAAKKGLDANILGGAGGGGGGAWGAFGGGSSDKYRAYLPGGAKDPSKGVAGQQAWTKEVTGQGGKSNWEKIKERYRDNKNSLLNN